MGLTVARPGWSRYHHVSGYSSIGQKYPTHVRVSAHLEVLRRWIRITLPGESRKVARHQLQSFQIASITQWVLVAVSEADVRTVEAEVGQVRVTIRVAGSDGTARESRSTEVVGIITSIRTIYVVVVSDLKSL